MADTFTSLSNMHFGPGAWSSQRVLLLAVCGILLLPLCFPRNLSAMGEACIWHYLRTKAPLGSPLHALGWMHAVATAAFSGISSVSHR